MRADEDESYEQLHKGLVRIRNERIEFAVKELSRSIEITVREWIKEHNDLFYLP